MNTQTISRWHTEIQHRNATLLDRLLLVAVVLGLVAMGLRCIALTRTMDAPERLSAMAPFVAGWLALLIVWAWRGVGYRARSLALLLLAYAVGIFAFARGGLPGSGQVWLLLPPALAFVLLGPRCGIAAGAASVVTCAFFVLAIGQKWVVAEVTEGLTTLAPPVSEAGAFVLVAVVLTLILWSFGRSWSQGLAGASVAHRQLQARIRELEEENERLHRQISRWQATAEIAHAGSSVLDPEKLLTRLVNRIQEGFSPMGVCCVGLFLFDKAQQWAVLKAATGEAGRSLLEKGHRVRLDETSPVGRCIIHRQARVVPGAGENTVRLDALLTPRARSEIALPLRSRGSILGALSMSSTQEEAFSKADIAILQTMADQVAVAIDNVVRFGQTKAALEELRAGQQRYLAQAWREFVATRPVVQVAYAQPGTERGDARFLREARRAAMVHERTVATSSPPPGDEGKAAAPQAALVVPLKLRGQVIGTMALHETGQQRSWTAEEIALAETVAEQVSLTVENLRLMDETQRRAARERLTREITDKMRRAVDIDSLMQTTLQEMATALDAPNAFVQLSTLPELAQDED